MDGRNRTRSRTSGGGRTDGWISAAGRGPRTLLRRCGPSAGPVLTCAAAVTAVAAVLADVRWAVATALCAFVAGRHPGRALHAAFALTVVLAADMAAVLAVPGWLPAGSRFVAVVIGAGMLFWFAGRLWLQYVELSRAGWERAERLTRERRLVAAQARLRERARIARDMHDVLGHELSLLALSAGALKLSPGLGPEQRRAAEDIRGRAETAVERLGEVIGVLREEPATAPLAPAGTAGSSGSHGSAGAAGSDVRRLADEASAAGLRVRLHIEGEPEAVPDAVLRAVHRVAQEGLTNVARHAPGSAAVVRVAYGGAASRVTVENDAPPATGRTGGARSRGGHGLVGLDERVRLAGGTFGCGPRPDGGFTVHAHLPHPGPGRPAPPPRDVPTGARPGPEPAPADGAAELPVDGRPSGTGRGAEEWGLAPVRRAGRRRIGRTVLVALTASLLAATVLGAVLTWWDMRVAQRSVLAREDFARLHPGMSRAEVEPYLPAEPTRRRTAGTPPEPAGGNLSCEYYVMTADPFADESGDTYRLCFRTPRGAGDTADSTLLTAETLRAGEARSAHPPRQEPRPEALPVSRAAPGAAAAPALHAPQEEGGGR
ncbi:sensor histidine kinase [Streptomyces cacaoi]|uniref:sensor histidine kinase n=1 Tax=Streptomyces cacaoi TaxID=1898 RepID=UPI001FD34757|nr:histidine kinase [Streptomyces cacaoi]